MSEPTVLPVTLTRQILTEILNAEDPLVVTAVGLSPTFVEPHADITAIPDELERWPVLDGYTNGNQISVYAEFPWQGEVQAIKTLAFYAGEDQDKLVALYSSEQVEAFLTEQVLLDGFWHLVLATVPAGSISVENTGYRFDPSIMDRLAILEECCAKQVGSNVNLVNITINGVTIVSADSTVTLTATAEALLQGATIAGYEWKISGVLSAETGNTLDVPAAAIGKSVNVQARAVDSYGNYSAWQNHVLTTSANEPPSTPIKTLGMPMRVTRGSIQEAAFSSSDPDSDAVTLELKNIIGCSASKTSGILPNERIHISIYGDTDLAEFDVVAVDEHGLESLPLRITRSGAKLVNPTGSLGPFHAGTHVITIPAGVSSITITGNGGAGTKARMNCGELVSQAGTKYIGSLSHTDGRPPAFPSDSVYPGHVTKVSKTSDGQRDYSFPEGWGSTITTGCFKPRYKQNDGGYNIVYVGSASYLSTAAAGADTVVSGDASHVFQGAAFGVTTEPESSSVSLELSPDSPSILTLVVAENGGKIESISY